MNVKSIDKRRDSVFFSPGCIPNDDIMHQRHDTRFADGSETECNLATAIT